MEGVIYTSLDSRKELLRRAKNCSGFCTYPVSRMVVNGSRRKSVRIGFSPAEIQHDSEPSHSVFIAFFRTHSPLAAGSNFTGLIIFSGLFDGLSPENAASGLCSSPSNRDQFLVHFLKSPFRFRRPTKKPLSPARHLLAAPQTQRTPSLERTSRLRDALLPSGTRRRMVYDFGCRVGEFSKFLSDLNVTSSESIRNLKVDGALASAGLPQRSLDPRWHAVFQQMG